MWSCGDPFNIIDLSEFAFSDSTLNFNKDWYELESFRDKYLVVRLIFDKFANKKIITNFSVENEDPSLH